MPAPVLEAQSGDFSDDHHRYQSSDEEDFQESVDKAVTLPKPILLWRTAAETQQSTTSTASLSTPPAAVRTCSTLIVGTAFGGSSLLHTLQSKTLLGTLILPGVDLKDNSLDLNSSSNASCNIYRLDADPTILLIPCNYEIKDKDSLNFAKAIMNNIQASRIIILDTNSPSAYLSGSPDIEYNYPWLRLLQTAGSTTVTKIPTLEVPNLVQNLGAALMGYCEVRGLSDTYLLLSLQEHVYGKALTTAATLRGLKEGLASLGCLLVANAVDVSKAVVQIQDKRVGSNRTREDRLYA
ncbi:Proteasome assembly chaperone 1 [Mortierella sp. GBA35]|nr:Proteasome assembly chaperone 1 [Mortierella sp. GBA35]